MKWIHFRRWLALALFPSLFFSRASVGANEFTPTAQMRTETLYMVRCLAGIHYNHRPLSALSMDEILTIYMESLDPQHLFFLKSDSEDIHSRYNLTLDIFLNSGSIKPAFAIYEQFRGRVDECVDDILQILDGKINVMDGEFYFPDRKDAAWPNNAEIARELWRKQIEFEFLNALLEEEGHEVRASAEENAPTTSLPTKEKSGNGPKTDFQRWEAAKTHLKKRYHRLRETINEMEPWAIQESFLDSVASLYDPHSSFLSSESLEEFQMLMTNSLVGIGVTLQDDNGYCKVIEIYPGSPADSCKQLQPGDRIIAVGQGDEDPVELIGMRFSRVVHLIRGPKGSTVTLYVQPVGGDPADRKIISLIRDEIQLTAQRARGSVYHVPNASSSGDAIPIGYIKLPVFYGASENDSHSDSYADVKELLFKLSEEQVRGVVLDLRGNTGGLLEEAIAIAGLFISNGPVVQVRDSDGHIQVFSDSNRQIIYNGPLVILTSKRSISASEILAGVLQDYGRALIVGDRATCGKGSVQAILPINQSILLSSNGPQLGAARITIQKWYLPNGESIQGRGVVADIPIPSIYDYLSIGEDEHKHALPWDSIPEVTIDRKEQHKFFTHPVEKDTIEKLLEKSLQRRSGREWELLEAHTNNFQRRMAQKEFSLQIDERRRKRSEDLAFRDYVKKEVEDLAETVFPKVDIRINAAHGIDEDRQLEDEEDAGKDFFDFDIHLRESLRILCDWLDLAMQ
ncbi:MAG: carboxy terminal-processing peptidase [Puniceicoccales bacterium]|nr:carboxy terminal-processing peptidase [Puniceicoccales bacterium]